MRINVTLSEEAEKEIKNYKDQHDLKHKSDDDIIDDILKNAILDVSDTDIPRECQCPQIKGD